MFSAADMNNGTSASVLPGEASRQFTLIVLKLPSWENHRFCLMLFKVPLNLLLRGAPVPLALADLSFLPPHALKQRLVIFFLLLGWEGLQEGSVGIFAGEQIAAISIQGFSSELLSVRRSDHSSQAFSGRN